MKFLVRWAAVAACAAFSTAAPAAVRTEYVHCYWKNNPNYLVTKPIAFEWSSPNAFKQVIDAWWAYIGQREGLSWAEINRLGVNHGAISCGSGSLDDQQWRFENNFSGPEWQRIEFPKQMLGKSLDRSGQTAGKSAGLIIEDREKSPSTAEVTARARLENQRETAQKKAKAAAEAAKRNAEVQAKLAKLKEEMRKRCGGAASQGRPGACAQ